MATEDALQRAKSAGAETVNSNYARYVLGVLIVVYIFNFIDRQIISILAEEIKAFRHR